MKRSSYKFLSFALLLTAGYALAGPPLDGVYQSTDLGGNIDVGRYSEGWDAGGGALMPGSTLNAGSWDGANFGLGWRYWCATTLSPATVLVDNVNANGDGNRTYMQTFVGGFIWLSGAGPWANGDPDYPGVIDTYTEFETIQYVNWQPVAAVTNVQATGHFDNYPSNCLTFAVGNGSQVGSTDWGMTKPADYPDFLQATTCDPVAPNGAWWDMLTLTLTISGCGTTDTDVSTWGGVKSLFR